MGTNTSGLRRGGPGRPKGAKNKKTIERNLLTRAADWIDGDAYFQNVKQRVERAERPDQLARALLADAPHQHQVLGLLEGADLLAVLDDAVADVALEPPVRLAQVLADLVVVHYSYWAWLPCAAPKVVALLDLWSDVMRWWNRREIEDRLEGGENKVPLLGDIPALGALFRYDTRKRVKTNLMVFLRPIVMRGAEDATKLSLDRYDLIRAQQKDAQPSRHLLLPINEAPVLPPQRAASDAK